MRLLVLLVAGVLAFAGLTAAAPPPTLRPGALTVGAEFPTPGFMSASRTQASGYEADLVTAVARRLGIAKVAWLEVPWETLWQAGTPQTFDFDVDSITITPARAKAVAFSAPYFRANLGLLVRRDSPIASTHTLKGLRGYRLGASTGTMGASYLAQTLRPRTAARSYASDALMLAALRTGKIDGLLLDVPAAVAFAQQRPHDFSVSGQIPVDQRYGLLFAKGSSLVGPVDSALASLRSDGTLTRIQQKWFPGSAALTVIR